MWPTCCSHAASRGSARSAFASRLARRGGASSSNCSPRASSWPWRRRCGLAISRLFLEGVLYALMRTNSDIAQLVTLINLSPPLLDWRLLAFLAAGAIMSTMIFGLAPALQATRVDLVSATRGEVMGGARPRHARHALIAVQVG